MKKILMIMLLSFTTMANADEGKYRMETDGDLRGVFVLNIENGDIKRCSWGDVDDRENDSVSMNNRGVVCTKWRRNSEDANDYYVYPRR